MNLERRFEGFSFDGFESAKEELLKIFIEQHIITASLFFFNLLWSLMLSLFHYGFRNVLHHGIKTFVFNISRQMPHDLILIQI